MAITFNGSTQYLSANAAVITGYPFTIFSWFNPTATNLAMYMADISNNTAAVVNAFKMRAAGDASQRVRITAGNGTTSDASSTSTTFSASTWQRGSFVGTSATSRTVRLNNAGAITGVASITPSGLDKTYIGVANTNTVLSGFFSGSLAHWAVWNIVLAATDLTLLEAGWSPWNVQRQALVCYLPLWDSNFGATDMTGNFTFTQQNSPTFAADPGVRFYLGNSFKGGF